MASLIIRGGIIAKPVREARIIALGRYRIVYELASRPWMGVCLTSDIDPETTYEHQNSLTDSIRS
jgi:hypothetical protein